MSKDEEYLRTVLVSSWTPNSAVKDLLVEKVIPSFNKGNEGLRKLLLRESEEVVVQLDSGELVRTARVRMDAARMDRIAEKIVRALRFYETGERFASDARFEVYWMPKNWSPEVAHRAKLVTVDPEVFQCRYFVATRDGREVSMWWMLFYESFMYVVATSTHAWEASPVVTRS